MKHIHTIYFFILLGIAAISVEGCSLIGLAIGSAIQTNPHDTTADFTKPIFHDASRNVGRFARIQYNDNTVRFATFDGYANEPDSAYRARWASFNDSHVLHSLLMPFKIGDSVAINGASYHNFVGKFEGYTADGLNDVVHIPLFGWITASNSKGQISLDELKLALDSNKVPVRGILSFTGSQGPFKLTNGDFNNTTFAKGGNAGAIGFLIGLAVDVAIIVAVAESIHFGFSGGSFGGGGFGGGGNLLGGGI